MPTLLLLDVSLSMCREAKNLVKTEADKVPQNLLQLGINFIDGFVDSLTESVSMEYVALGLFADEVDLAVPFTTDYESIKSLCQSGVDVHGKSLLSPALRSANLSCLSTWGRNTFCEIVVITDGLTDESVDFELTSEIVADFSIPFAFPSVVKFVILSAEANLPFYQQLCERNLQTNSSGIVEGVHVVNLVDHQKGVASVVREMIDQDYKRFFATLTCGSLASPVELVPSPRAVHKLVKDFEVTEGVFSGTISVVGFMKPADLAHAPIIARHLVVATPKVDQTDAKGKSSNSTPSLCVLLHGSFKLEENVAICTIGDNWFAMLYVLPEVKKTHLLLNCFAPGVDSVPWLGDLSTLKLTVFDGNPPSSCFPVMQKQRCSYFTGPQQANLSFPCWIQSFGLQADIQKVLRYVRKLPEKQAQFYQELNRLCNYALAIGFTGLMEETIVALLDREVNSAHQNNPEAAKHLQHAKTLLT